MSHPSVPPSLANVLKHAGFRGAVLLERLDGQPMSAADAELARAIVEMHEANITDEQISAAVGKALARKAPPQATGTDG